MEVEYLIVVYWLIHKKEMKVITFKVFIFIWQSLNRLNN